MLHSGTQAIPNQQVQRHLVNRLEKLDKCYSELKNPSQIKKASLFYLVDEKIWDQFEKEDILNSGEKQSLYAYKLRELDYVNECSSSAMQCLVSLIKQDIKLNCDESIDWQEFYEFLVYYGKFPHVIIEPAAIAFLLGYLPKLLARILGQGEHGKIKIETTLNSQHSRNARKTTCKVDVLLYSEMNGINECVIIQAKIKELQKRKEEQDLHYIFSWMEGDKNPVVRYDKNMLYRTKTKQKSQCVVLFDQVKLVWLVADNMKDYYYNQIKGRVEEFNCRVVSLSELAENYGKAEAPVVTFLKELNSISGSAKS